MTDYRGVGAINIEERVGVIQSIERWRDRV